MSYAHTKRRKLIAQLKRHEGRNWFDAFNYRCREARKRLDGPLVGSLEQILVPDQENYDAYMRHGMP